MDNHLYQNRLEFASAIISAVLIASLIKYIISKKPADKHDKLEARIEKLENEIDGILETVNVLNISVNKTIKELKIRVKEEKEDPTFEPQ